MPPDHRMHAAKVVPSAPDSWAGLSRAVARALRATRDTGFAHFWSRSRASLWKKGESSGHTLAVVDVRIDCDADTILLQVHQVGKREEPLEVRFRNLRIKELK